MVVEDAKTTGKEHPFGTTAFRRVLEKEPKLAGAQPQVNYERDLLLLPYSRYVSALQYPSHSAALCDF